MNRDTLVRILRETAALLELEGAVVFRVRAYENAARTFEGLTEEQQELLERGALAELPGVGPGLVASVAELVQTGRSTVHEELKRRYPPGLLDLFRVGGLGPKRIRVLYQSSASSRPPTSSAPAARIASRRSRGSAPRARRRSSKGSPISAATEKTLAYS